jgi:hypothetical protein
VPGESVMDDLCGHRDGHGKRPDDDECLLHRSQPPSISKTASAQDVE